MNTIYKIDLHLLRNSEHHEFMTELKTAIGVYTIETLGITGDYPLFESTLHREELANRAEKGSIRSKTIANLNKKRDCIWRSIKHRIESAVLSPIPEEVESGKVLKRIFTQFGNLTLKPVTEKSASMHILLDVLLKVENASHLEVVNIARIVPELKKENDNYMSAVRDRNAEIAGRNKRNAGRIRREMDPVYYKIVDTINASITLNIAQPAVAKFVKELNFRIKTLKTTLAARKTISRKARQRKGENFGVEERIPESPSEETLKNNTGVVELM